MSDKKSNNSFRDSKVDENTGKGWYKDGVLEKVVRQEGEHLKFLTKTIHRFPESLLVEIRDYNTNSSWIDKI